MRDKYITSLQNILQEKSSMPWVGEDIWCIWEDKNKLHRNIREKERTIWDNNTTRNMMQGKLLKNLQDDYIHINRHVKFSPQAENSFMNQPKLKEHNTIVLIPYSWNLKPYASAQSMRWWYYCHYVTGYCCLNELFVWLHILYCMFCSLQCQSLHCRF